MFIWWVAGWTRVYLVGSWMDPWSDFFSIPGLLGGGEDGGEPASSPEKENSSAELTEAEIRLSLPLTWYQINLRFSIFFGLSLHRLPSLTVVTLPFSNGNTNLAGRRFGRRTILSPAPGWRLVLELTGGEGRQLRYTRLL